MKSAGHRDVEASLRRIETTRSSGIVSNKSGPALDTDAGEERHLRRFFPGVKTPSPASAE